jgi:predicted amidohydrolase YtcJ
MRHRTGILGASTVIGLVIAAMVLDGTLAAQAPNVRAKLPYPETVVHNAKIVTVDDHTFEGGLGSVVNAMAISQGKILAVGTEAEMKALAGSDTKFIDLGGRTVVPGMVLVHNHPMDWAPVVPEILEKVVPKDILTNRMIRGTPQSQLEKFPAVLAEAVASAKSGAWIQIILVWDFEVDPEDPNLNFFGKQVTKEQLDKAAPNNPVIVRSREILQRTGRGSILNQKAIDIIRRDAPPDHLADLGNLERQEKTGIAGSIYRLLWPEIILKNRPELFEEMLRLDLEWWAARGQTTFGSFLYHYANVIRGFRMLDRKGTIANRVAWGWGAVPDVAWARAVNDPFLIMDLATREGEGTDYMWYIGSSGGGEEGSGSCVSLQPIRKPAPGEPRLIMQGGGCEGGFGPNDPAWKLVKAGGRYMAGHIFGDVAIDNILRMIEQASKEGGLTKEQIIAKRHIVGDHMNGWPRPDQIPRIKDIGGIVGGTNIYILDQHLWLRDYGERGPEMIVPRGALFKANVMNGIEVDKPLELTDSTIFHYLTFGMHRKDKKGRSLLPHQQLNREQALKSATLWGAYYVLKENQLGSLEPGKFADFLVLDRDYMTVPLEEIEKIKPLMTMVGGRIVHLTPSLAKELKMQPAGAEVLLGGPASKY